MLIAYDAKFASMLSFPKKEDNVYYMKDIVSRKKQLIPLLSELVAKVGD